MSEARTIRLPGRRGVLGIGLGRFQVMDAYTWIPLGPLTLLFGPNSAGKSVVADALDVAWDIWSGQKALLDPAAGNPFLLPLAKLWRNARKPTQKRSEWTPVRIDVEAWVSVSDSEFDTRLATHFPSFAAYFANDVLVRGRLEAGGAEDSGHPTHIFLDIDGEPLYEFLEAVSASRDPHEARINFGHASLRQDAALLDAFEREGATRGSSVALEDGWVAVRGVSLEFGNRLNFGLDLATTASDEAGAQRLAEFKLLHDFITRRIGAGLANACRMGRVGASRSVPSARELTYHVGEFEELPEELTSDARLSATEERAEFRGLAKALLAIDADVTAAMGAHSDLESEDGPSGALPAQPHLVALFVNRMLREHLSLDNAYQLAADVRYMRKAHELLEMARAGAPESLRLGPPALVRIELKDAHGRKFDFTEVGSGIGYLLPVLVHSFENPQSFVEQPELHLHPALQSRLGDVFLELAIKGRRSLIIESHSEHLLLRILRRVRESRDPESRSTAIQVERKDIVVLYFDPKPQGFTRVYQMRLTDDGNFMDRWPRGFFNERDEDLFSGDLRP